MSSFSSRPVQLWKSSLAETLTSISGAFAFEVIPTVMVLQTLEFLSERNGITVPDNADIVNGFTAGMRHYSSEHPNNLLYWKSFKDAAELFAMKFDDLTEVVRQLETHLDINLTFSRVAYLADVGIGPTQPLMIFERMPFSRGVGFEIEERGKVTQSLAEGDLRFSPKARAAQHHYSTGLALLAAEDQIAGLIDAAFMQFYLAIECILETHEKSNAQNKGCELFPNSFTSDLGKIVGHVYLARHRFFGHGHPKQQKAHSDSDTAFAITKQALVARWCARKLISLDLNRGIVGREMRFYGNLNGSIEFRGDLASLTKEFALPT